MSRWCKLCSVSCWCEVSCRVEVVSQSLEGACDFLIDLGGCLQWLFHLPSRASGFRHRNWTCTLTMLGTLGLCSKHWAHTPECLMWLGWRHSRKTGRSNVFGKPWWRRLGQHSRQEHWSLFERLLDRKKSPVLLRMSQFLQHFGIYRNLIDITSRCY